MNSKLVAILMAIIMSVAALIISAPTAGAEEGDADHPYYLIGSEKASAALYQSDSDGLKARMGFNQAAYTLSGSVKFSYSTGGAYQNIAIGSQTSVNSGGALVTISSTSDSGVYEFTLKYAAQEKTTKLTIKVEITAEYKTKTTTLDYYYGANVRSIASGHEDTGKDQIAVDPVSKEGSAEYLKVVKGEVPVFKLWAYNPQDSTRAAILNTYNFYASGLPAGLAVKVDVAADHEFVITGKVIHDIKADEGKNYKSYAVTINAADANGNILSKNITLRVYLNDVEFSYVVETEDGSETEEDDVTKIIKAGTSISVKPEKSDGSLNPNVKVFYTGPDGTQVPISLVGGKYTYTSGPDDSGVVEIIMKNTVGDVTVQHKVTTLIVGSIVHSGLDPVVTSS